MDLKELLAQAQAAIAAGGDINAINQILGQQTRGHFDSVELLARTVGAGPTATQLAEQSIAEMPSPALERLGEGGTGAGDFATLAANSLSFGFLPEIMGIFNPEAAERMEQRISDVREEAPLMATLPAEVAGGMLLPGGAALGAARGGGLGRAALTGAAAGAAAGSLTGIGEGEGSLGERLPGAIVPGLFGGAVGAVAAPLAQAGRAVTKRVFQGPPNARVGRGLAEIGGDADAPGGLFNRAGRNIRGGPALTEIDPADAALQQIRNQVTSVGEEVYAPFAQQGPSRELRGMVSMMAQEPGIRTAIQDPALRYDLLSEPPDFTNLRRIRNRLQDISKKEQDPNGTFNRLFRRFDEEMQVAFPGVQEANRAYALAKETEEAFIMGFRNARREGESAAEGIAGWQRPSEVREMLRTFQDNPAAQDAMRQGMRNRLLDDLSLTRAGTPRQIEMFMQADDGGEALMRELFPQGVDGDLQFDAFKRLVREDAATETVLRQARAGGKWGAIAVGAGAAAAAGGYGVRSLFGGGSEPRGS